MLPNLLNANASPGPHLPVALLRQYAAGSLAPAAQHRVEAHTLACTRCADVLAGLLQTPPATTDQALAQLQRRLRQRTQPVAPDRLGWAARRTRRWLAPQLAVAAVLLLSLVAGGWWAWQQRHRPVGSPEVATTTTATTVAPPLARAAAPQAQAAPSAAAAAQTESSPAVAGAIAKLQPKPVPKLQSKPQPNLVESGRQPVRPRTVSPGLVVVAPAAPVVAAAASVAPSAARVGRGLVRADSVAIAAVPAADAAAGAARARVATGRLSEVVVSEPTRAARPRAKMPEPPPLRAAPVGGQAELREYLRQQAADFVPEPAAGGPLSGTVLVRLRIGADGKIEQAEAVRKLRADYDAEAIRLLREGPAWVPGTGQGRRVAQSVEVGVSF